MKRTIGLCLAGMLGVVGVASGQDLVAAVRNRDAAEARQLLRQRANVNAVDAEGMTALHWAAHWADQELVKQLIAAGANVKAGNRYGVTPLHEAATRSAIRHVFIGESCVWLRGIQG